MHSLAGFWGFTLGLGLSGFSLGFRALAVWGLGPVGGLRGSGEHARRVSEFESSLVGPKTELVTVEHKKDPKSGSRMRPIRL